MRFQFITFVALLWLVGPANGVSHTGDHGCGGLALWREGKGKRVAADGLENKGLVVQPRSESCSRVTGEESRVEVGKFRYWHERWW